VSPGRRLLLAGTPAAVAIVAGGWLALGASGPASPAARAAEAPAAAAQRAELPPLPERRRPRVVQPEAGSAAEAAPASEAAPTEPRAPRPRKASSRRPRTDPDLAGASAGGVRRATALPNGIALPPLEAPEAVLKIIEAGNAIARTPYKWGGGHGKWLDTGYDCSGSVSFALAAAGLLDGPLASGPLMSWGEPGRGKWVTIYANAGHVYLEVAGIRFDTSGARQTGSRWQNELRGNGGFVARHPPGL